MEARVKARESKIGRTSVMAGFGPAIHGFVQAMRTLLEDANARAKPGFAACAHSPGTTAVSASFFLCFFSTICTAKIASS